MSTQVPVLQLFPYSSYLTVQWPEYMAVAPFEGRTGGVITVCNCCEALSSREEATLLVSGFQIWKLPQGNEKELVTFYPGNCPHPSAPAFLPFLVIDAKQHPSWQLISIVPGGAMLYSPSPQLPEDNTPLVSPLTLPYNYYNCSLLASGD